MSWLSFFAQTACKASSNFLGFPNWYRGLKCESGDGGVMLSGLGDIWVIVANITEIALRLAAILAIIFIIIGGLQYITSSGEPEKTKRAQGILTNAVIGLVVSVLATLIVGIIARSLS